MKKTIERDTDDPSYVITTYQGTHNHDHPYFCPIQMYQRPKQGELKQNNSSNIIKFHIRFTKNVF